MIYLWCFCFFSIIVGQLVINQKLKQNKIIFIINFIFIFQGLNLWNSFLCIIIRTFYTTPICSFPATFEFSFMWYHSFCSRTLTGSLWENLDSWSQIALFKSKIKNRCFLHKLCLKLRRQTLTEPTADNSKGIMFQFLFYIFRFCQLWCM